MKSFLILFSTLTLTACTQPKPLPAAVEKESETQQMEMTEKNRTIGVIQQAVSKEGCLWTIRIKEVDYLLDPTNLAKEFMVNEQRVRFDYLPLRMKNRCPEANPIEVISMEKMK